MSKGYTEGYRKTHWLKKLYVRVVDHPEAGKCLVCGYTRFEHAWVRGKILRCRRCWAKHRFRLELVDE